LQAALHFASFVRAAHCDFLRVTAATQQRNPLATVKKSLIQLKTQTRRFLDPPGLLPANASPQRYNPPMEPTEIQEFSNQLKEAGEGEHGESLTNISLAISILAVLVAMVTVLGHRSHTEAVLAQSRAGDKWSEYQAQKIRADNTQTVIDLLRLQPSTDSAAVEKKVSEYTAHIAKWNSQLASEQEEAHDLEAEVHHAEAQAGRFDLGEALLQISVVLCSITLFTRRRLYFFLGLGIGALGLAFAASALLVH
jgi:hypothetical protein